MDAGHRVGLLAWTMLLASTPTIPPSSGSRWIDHALLQVGSCSGVSYEPTPSFARSCNAEMSLQCVAQRSPAPILRRRRPFFQFEVGRLSPVAADGGDDDLGRQAGADFVVAKSAVTDGGAAGWKRGPARGAGAIVAQPAVFHALATPAVG